MKAPGAAPFIQGYYQFTEGRSRNPPSWHAGHKNKKWISEWYRGYDEACEKKTRKVKYK